jgi:undecaprenyl-diphosphatase
MLEVTILAILQGVAEFLPISSSGHLVIAQNLLGVNEPGMRLDMFLHLGTLIAIFAYYWKTVRSLVAGLSGKESWIYAAKIVASAVPAIIVYACFHSQIKELFESTTAVGALLMFTGAVLVATRFLPSGVKDIDFLRALAMGAAQAVAILPGVSRSGMTLAAARAGRVAPEKAAEFSFLMSAPLIAGGALLETLTAAPAEGAQIGWGLTLYGAVIAAVVGYFSLALLVKTLKGRHFWLFGVYCFAAGLLAMYSA